VLRPRTKRALHPFRLPGGDILVARDVFGLGRTLPDDAQATVWKLLGLMDGTRDVRALHRSLHSEGLSPTLRAVGRAVAQLHQEGIVEDAAERPPPGLSGAERDRYSRNLDFFSLLTVGSPGSALAAQRRLKASRVTVLGVGAVGSTIAASLAAAGVGRLRVLDPDRVEASNLNRQLLYRSGDIGRPKAEAAAGHLKAINPHVRVEYEKLRVDAPSDLTPLMRDCDLFVLGADQPHEIMLWANDAAVSEGTPWLENSYSGPRCAIALFIPGRTPCLRCLQHDLVVRERRRGVFEGENLFRSDESNAVVAPTAGIAGHYGALRALYFLSGLRTADEGALIQINLWRPEDIRVVRPKYWAACPACGGTPRRRTGPPKTAKAVAGALRRSPRPTPRRRG
jgi:molybdopterin/thiamine biosynthesis adenylyltransferase